MVKRLLLFPDTAKTGPEKFTMADTVGTIMNNEKASNEDWTVNYSVYNGKIGVDIGVADVDFGSDGTSEIAMKLGDSQSPAFLS